MNKKPLEANKTGIMNQCQEQLEKAERLLTCLKKVFRHDLPNQLLVQQGMLQLLEMEEGNRLSREGQDYLQRIKAANQRALEMSRLLAEIASLGSRAKHPEKIHLGSLLEEVIGEIKLQMPSPILACQGSFAV